jgi:beta-fructofuranosidase
MSDSMNGPFAAPPDNVLDGNGFIFYAAKTAELNGTRYLCGWLGRAALSVDSSFYQWAGNVLNHQLVQLEDGRLGVCAPDTFAEYFTAEQPFSAEEKEGIVGIDGNNITLTAEEGSYALADMGTRAPTMILECDVTLDEDGCAGFAFGGSAKDEDYTALCLDAENGILHYEGYTIEELTRFDPAAFTVLDFSKNSVHHVTLVCENEIVVLYVDDMKALSSRISHSIDGAHIGVFADCSAAFSNISIRIPD